MRSLASTALAVAAFTSVLRPGAKAEAILHLGTRVNGLAFRLDGDAEAGFWVLQHSPDASGWDDLLFLNLGEDGGASPGVTIPWGALPADGAPAGFFRARHLGTDDPALRDFLAARVRWRLSGFDRYRYGLHQYAGMFSWRGTVTVMEGEVASFETIELFPPFAETPDVPTIDRLFARIAGAMANGAETIDVTWHPEFGYPVSCFIDQSSLIADEEQGWTIESFAALR